MAQLFSQYESGVQLTAGTITGSVLGVSGLNPIVDRLNSISTDNNLITGSLISGTNSVLFVNGINIDGILSGTNLNIISKYQNGNLFTGSLISGTATVVSLKEGKIIGSPTVSSDIVTKNYADNTFIINALEKGNSSNWGTYISNWFQVNEDKAVIDTTLPGNGGSVAKIYLNSGQSAAIYGNINVHDSNMNVPVIEVYIKRNSTKIFPITALWKGVKMNLDNNGNCSINIIDTVDSTGSFGYGFYIDTLGGAGSSAYSAEINAYALSKK